MRERDRQGGERERDRKGERGTRERERQSPQPQSRGSVSSPRSFSYIRPFGAEHVGREAASRRVSPGCFGLVGPAAGGRSAAGRRRRRWADV